MFVNFLIQGQFILSFKFNESFFLAADPCNNILEKENFKLLEINGEITQHDTKNCEYGLGTLTSNNKVCIESFITCLDGSRRVTKTSMFQIACDPDRVLQNCPTYYVFVKANTYECLEICSDITTPYAVVCKKKPKSYTNTILGAVSTLIVLITFCIWSWRNRKSIIVS